MTAVATKVFEGIVRGESAPKKRSRFDRRALGSALFTFVGYYLGSHIGFALTFQPHPVSVLWPPNSILLAALLLSPVRLWWLVLAAAFPAHCLAQAQSDIPWPMLLCYFVSNSCEALIGASCIRYFIPGQIRFDNLRGTALFCVFGGLAGPFLSSFLDAGFVQMNHWGSGNYWEIWRIRFFSNVLTALTLAPSIVMWFANRDGRSRLWKRKDYLETTLLFVGLIVASYIALYKKGPSGDPLIFYGPLPFLLWAALRLGSRVTTNAVLIITFLAIWSAAHGHGPFTGESPEENARAIQMFLIVIAIPMLFLTAGIEERRAADERFAKAFRASPNAMAISRVSDGTLLDVNQQWLSMFGYRRGEVIGRTVFDLGLYPVPEDRATIVARLANGETVRDFEGSVYTRTKGPRRALLSAERVELSGEPCLVIITQDITDRKRAEEADRDLAHAARLAVVGELTASIAHEINQPLGAILSNAEAAEMLLESDSPPLDEVRKILADIRKDDLRASETIRHIRLLTRKREMRMESLDLNEIAFEVMRLVATDARRRKVPLRTEFTASPTTVLGDRIHLQQVLMNLVLNAMDAMNETPENERQLFVRIATNGQKRVEVSVTDSGRGILPERLPRLFESFFTTKESGMGLGLAIARSIIDAHQGHILAENNSDRGATFRFDLPICNGEAIPS